MLGGVDTGWTFYTPYSTMFSNSYVVLTLVGVFVTGFSSILTGLNFIVTVHTLRAPGMGWFRLPLFVVGDLRDQPDPGAGDAGAGDHDCCCVVAERLFQVGIFDPALGGDPLLFQHLFWFYSHPAVYIMVLPAMGVVSEIIPCFARKPDLRLPLHGLRDPGHRRRRLPGLGPPHVRRGPVAVRRAWCSRC